MSPVDDGGAVAVGFIVLVAVTAAGVAWLCMLLVDVLFDAGRSVVARLRVRRRRPVAVVIPVQRRPGSRGEWVGVHRLEGVTRRMVARPR